MDNALPRLVQMRGCLALELRDAVNFQGEVFSHRTHTKNSQSENKQPLKQGCKVKGFCEIDDHEIAWNAYTYGESDSLRIA